MKMMNPSNTFLLVSPKFGRPSWGMIYWQFVATLNERFFQSTSRTATDREDVPKHCCELSKMDIEVLLRKYQQTGDSSFMGEVYKRYAHLVLGTCLKYLKDESKARDAVSDIFTKLVVKLQTFFPIYFPGWLYKVSVNHCLEVLRKEQSRPEFESFDSVLEIESMADPETPEYVHREIRHHEISNALKALPERQRITIELFFLKGLSYRQVTEKTGFSLNDVKSYVQNGKRNLRIALAAAADEYGWRKSV